MMMQRFSKDIVINIVKFLDPVDLLHGCEVSKFWSSAIEEDSERIWGLHSFLLYKRLNIPTIAMESVLDSIKRIPISQLKVLLRKVDTTRCIKEVDLQRMFLAKLFYSERSIKVLSHKLYFPDWTLNINEHKASYYFHKRQVARNEIYLQELCEIDWTLSFLLYDNYHSHIKNKFLSDYTYFSPHFDDLLPWQVLIILP